MCSRNIKNRIKEAVRHLCSTGLGQPFSAKQVVELVRADTDEYVTHREVAIETFNLFQNGEFGCGWFAMPVSKNGLTFVAYVMSPMLGILSDSIADKVFVETESEESEGAEDKIESLSADDEPLDLWSPDIIFQATNVSNPEEP